MFFFLISEVDFLNETFSVLQKYFSVHKGKLFKSWIFLCVYVCTRTLLKNFLTGTFRFFNKTVLILNIILY